MASLYSEESDAAVYAMVEDGDTFGFWFGLYQHAKDEPWFTMDGATTTYTNWDQGQPQRNKEHCGMINWAGKSKWHDGKCEKERSFICSFHSPCHYPTLTIIEEEPEIIICEHPELPEIEPEEEPNVIEYHFLNTPMPFEEAEDECRKEYGQGAHLASMNTPEEVENLNTIVRDTGITEAWIGLNTPKKSEPFRWTDGTPNTISQWAEGEPRDDRDDDELCVEMVMGLNTLEWKTAKCDKPIKPMCSKRTYDDGAVSPNTPF